MNEEERRQELVRRLSVAFEAWKKDGAGSTEVDNLNKSIGLAMSNGIDLVLKISKSVLDITETGKRPISRQDAIEFSTGTEGDFILFDIPSNLNKGNIQRSKRFELVAVNAFRDEGSVLLLKTGQVGAFGIFSPDQVAALEVK